MYRGFTAVFRRTKKEISLKEVLAVPCPTCGAASGRSVNLARANRARIHIETADRSQKTSLSSAYLDTTPFGTLCGNSTFVPFIPPIDAGRFSPGASRLRGNALCPMEELISPRSVDLPMSHGRAVDSVFPIDKCLTRRRARTSGSSAVGG